MKIDGTWGWPVVPEAVIQATIIVAHGIIARRNSPGGLAGGGDFGMVEQVPGYVDPTVLTTSRSLPVRRRRRHRMTATLSRCVR